MAFSVTVQVQKSAFWLSQDLKFEIPLTHVRSPSIYHYRQTLLSSDGSELNACTDSPFSRWRLFCEIRSWRSLVFFMKAEVYSKRALENSFHDRWFFFFKYKEYDHQRLFDFSIWHIWDFSYLATLCLPPNSNLNIFTEGEKKKKNQEKSTNKLRFRLKLTRHFSNQQSSDFTWAKMHPKIMH